MTQSIKVMKGIVWLILVLSILFVLDVAKSVGFDFRQVFEFLGLIPYVLVLLPALVLLFTSNRFASKEQDKKIQVVILSGYLLIALALINYLYYAVIHI